MVDLEQGIHDIIKRHSQVARLEKGVTREILKYLDSQGVVVKVDGGVPPIQGRFTERENGRRMKAEGWVKTERLV